MSESVSPLRKVVGPDGIQVRQGVRSPDYGTGTIVAIYGAMGVQIYWDEPLVGSKEQHLLLHDRVYVERLEKL
jgi:hypothetical protein